MKVKITRHLLWVRLDLGSTSASSTNDALNLAVVDGVTCFVWCSARQEIPIEGRVTGEVRRVCLQVTFKRLHNLSFGGGIVTGGESADVVRNEGFTRTQKRDTYMSKSICWAS